MSVSFLPSSFSDHPIFSDVGVVTVKTVVFCLLELLCSSSNIFSNGFLLFLTKQICFVSPGISSFLARSL